MMSTDIRNTRESQGLPPTITDPGVLAKVAALVAPRMNDVKVAPRRGKRGAKVAPR